ncbi:MAG: hypothetical protein ACKVJA_03420, partial [Flavobacteriales bacterium]
MKKLLYIIIYSILIYSCKHELESPTWEIDMIVPIAHAEITINDISEQITTETGIIIGTDSLVSLIYSTELLSSKYDDLFNINTITEQNISKVSDINFNNINISNTFTLGSVISEIPLGTILFPDGGNSMIPNFPSALQNDTTFVDASEYFENMTLSHGYLIINIENNFPTDLSNINLVLLNAITLSTIADFTYPIIASGTSLSDSVNISGQNLDKNIISIIKNMDVNASNGAVPINYTDNIITTISLTQLVINEATAIFPEQQISEELKEFSINLGNAKIRELKVKEGTVDIKVLSTLPDTGRLFYNIPSLTKDGIPFISENIIPPSIYGEWTTITHNFDGYILDLSGKEGRVGGDTINTIYTEMYAFIDSTGELVTLTETDSFCSYVELHFIPEYAKGYIGQDTFTVEPEITDIDLPDGISYSTFYLNEANINLTIENFVGADAIIIINEFNTDNTDNNSPPISVSTDINGNNIIGNNYIINRATLDNGELPITPTYTNIEFDASSMIEIIPNQATFGASIILNPNGEQSTEDFLFTEFSIYANLDAEIPLSFIAENLTLSKTIIKNLSSDHELEIDELYITLQNGFPLSSTIDVILLDQYNNILDTLIDNKEIISGNMNSENRVISPSETIITITNINYNDVRKIKVIANFSTSSLTEHINIYSSYILDVSLSAKFRRILG